MEVQYQQFQISKETILTKDFVFVIGICEIWPFMHLAIIT